MSTFGTMKKLFLLLLISGFFKCCMAQDVEIYNLYFEGNALVVKGQYDKAIDKYNQALKLFQAAYVYYNRGNAYYGKKDYANAVLDYTKTLKLNSGYAEAYYQRGLIKSTTGDKTCCDDLKKAVKLELADATAAFKKNCK